MKKRSVKIVVGLLATLILLVAIGLAYVKLALPDVGPPPDMKIQATAAQIEHGKYLANHVAVCVDCHSTRDMTKMFGPMIVGTEGKGGEKFSPEQGFPGTFYSRNITGAGVGDWTDGEIYRAITTGVSRDGSALFPVMPYRNYGQMHPDDIKDIIAYLRSLKPIPNSIPPTAPDFPMNFIVNTIPAKQEPGQKPDTTDRIAYGKYVSTFASCGECHTPVDGQGQPLPGMEMAGGREFPMPTGMVRSMNITPAKTGIGTWTKAAFIARFKTYAGQLEKQPTVQEGEFNSIMPWLMYAGMSEQDLGAIYDYLRTVKPVENKVDRFTSKAKLVAIR
ncbi:c-type cytochrome [Spirosoma validum]|uniref:C-type cytochrome n=1 Tax=Spirosoma validum TaxID=2771355 RepID=A0A927GDH3_9BACT|nr:c-type cytochrome [Spirosoma validum]MBD2753565.1 c-type cytochrome [Spirosoma validum]